MKKRCSCCHKLKPLSAFYKDCWNKKDGHNNNCIECQKERARKKKVNNKHKTYRKEKRNGYAWVDMLKTAQGCADCKEHFYNEPYILHYHHEKPKLKNDTIANMVKEGASHTKILVEIAKCIVLCGNCHARRHHTEINSS